MKAYSRIKKISNFTLEFANEFLSEDVIVADVGTDHGYLAEFLSRNDKISKVIASDISQKCLDKVIKIKNECNLDKVETRLGDGFCPIDFADLMVVAGIGGFEIIKMLETQNVGDDGNVKCSLFVLQPSQNVYELRKWLFDNEMFVWKDIVFESAKRFYPILAVDVSRKQINEHSIFNLYLGRDNTLENVEFVRFLKDNLQTLQFLNDVTSERMKDDKILKEKFELKLCIENILKK